MTSGCRLLIANIGSASSFSFARPPSLYDLTTANSSAEYSRTLRAVVANSYTASTHSRVSVRMGEWFSANGIERTAPDLLSGATISENLMSAIGFAEPFRSSGKRIQRTSAQRQFQTLRRTHLMGIMRPWPAASTAVPWLPRQARQRR